MKQEADAQETALSQASDQVNALQADNQSLKTSNLELTNQLAMKDDDDDEMSLGGFSSPTGGMDFASSMAEKERVMRLEQENNDLKATVESMQSCTTGGSADES